MKNQNDEEYPLSPDKIRKALNTMQLAAVTTSFGENYIKTQASPLGAKIFKRLKLDMPSNINTKNDLIDCFKLDSKPLTVQMSFL